MNKMRRYPDRGWIGGVCAGAAEYFDWNLKLVRALVALALFFTGFFPVGAIYLILWYVLEPGSDSLASSGRDPRSAPASGRSTGVPGGATATDVRARFARLEERLRGLEECVTSREFELRRELRKLEG